jgi:hypothetical protein
MDCHIHRFILDDVWEMIVPRIGETPKMLIPVGPGVAASSRSA